MSDRESKLATREAIAGLQQVRAELDKLEAENRQQDRLTLSRGFLIAVALVGGFALIVTVVHHLMAGPAEQKATSIEQRSGLSLAEVRFEEKRLLDAFAESISRRLGMFMTESDYPAEARAKGGWQCRVPPRVQRVGRVGERDGGAQHGSLHPR